MADSVPRHTPLTVEKSFKIVSGAIEFDPVDGVRVVTHDMAILGCLRIDIEVEVLVKVDVARGDVMEHRRVALAVSNLAIIRAAASTGHESVVSIVLNLELEINVLVLRVTSCVVIFEGAHGHATEEIGERGDCIGEAAKGGS